MNLRKFEFKSKISGVYIVLEVSTPVKPEDYLFHDIEMFLDSNSASLQDNR